MSVHSWPVCLCVLVLITPCLLRYHFRMDVDQSARNNAQEYFGVKDPDFYEFEGLYITMLLLNYLRGDCQTDAEYEVAIYR